MANNSFLLIFPIELVLILSMYLTILGICDVLMNNITKLIELIQFIQ